MKKKFRKSIGSDVPTLVFFYATWCIPCKLMKPTVLQIQEEMGNALNSLEIDVEIKKGIVKRYNVKSVPTLILFKNGKPLWRHSGVMPVAEIKTAINDRI